MSEQISPTTASLSAQALSLVSREIRTRQNTPERTQAADRRSAAPKRRAEAEAVQKQEARLSKRVDQLVQRKKAVSSRISSEAVSPPQRTVLVSRANDLQRQVNELDGIVGGEGQGDLSSTAVLAAQPQTATPAAFKPQVASAKPKTAAVPGLKTAAAPGVLRSAPAPKQPATDALRAFAKNSPAPQAAAAKVDLSASLPEANSQVDLIA